jgi:hypothetical protein
MLLPVCDYHIDRIAYVIWQIHEEKGAEHLCYECAEAIEKKIGQMRGIEK